MSDVDQANFNVTDNIKDRFFRWAGILPPVCTPLTLDKYEDIYKEPPSFTQFLPFKDYDEKEGVFLMDDGLSVGVIFDLTPIDVDGQSSDILQNIELGIQ